jgi:hypothetical protein
MILPSGQLEKMYLIAYESNEQDAAKVNVDGEEKFVFQVNPETYKRRYAIEYTNRASVPGTMSDPGTYNRTQPETFTVDILFDSSGVIKSESLLSIAIVNPFASNETEDVTERLIKFKKFCYDYQSETHRPYYVRLCWGDESGFFFGVVTSLEIDFKLFKPNGKPIRAVAHLGLQEAEDRILTNRRRDMLSPDITHEKTFKSGDEFSHMSYRQYRDSQYYIDVAKANKLLSFRNIRQGQVLQFPPLK